jgi:hypothetical protein
MLKSAKRVLFTHPIIASLDHPLFPRSEERVAQRSVGGVSNRNHAKLVLLVVIY